MHSCRVLVVEDEKDIRNSLVAVLEEENHEVLAAVNGLDALQKLRNDVLPNIILLDLRMPVMNGWKFLAECQSDPLLCQVPVLVVSAEKNVSAMSGMTSFMCKPLDINTLLKNIELFAR